MYCDLQRNTSRWAKQVLQGLPVNYDIVVSAHPSPSSLSFSTFLSAALNALSGSCPVLDNWAVPCAGRTRIYFFHGRRNVLPVYFFSEQRISYTKPSLGRECLVARHNCSAETAWNCGLMPSPASLLVASLICFNFRHLITILMYSIDRISLTLNNNVNQRDILSLSYPSFKKEMQSSPHLMKTY